MAFTFGFYNSVDHDRVYTAEDLSSIFEGIIADGVFKTVPIDGAKENNDRFEVTTISGMTVSVGRGKAWFNHTWNTNSTRMALTLDDAHGIYDRYDAIVLEIRSTVEYRRNQIMIVKGAPAQNPTKPTMINLPGQYQHALAYIHVRAGSSSVVESDIENVVGTQETPYATSISDDIAIRIANNLTTPDEQDGMILDARQGRVLNETKFNKANVTNSLSETREGYALDARAGKTMNDQLVQKLDKSAVVASLNVSSPGSALDATMGKSLNQAISGKFDKANVVNSLTETRSGYALDARIGATISGKFDKANVVNSLTETRSGYALDARIGATISAKLNKSDVKNDLSTTAAGYALDASRGAYLKELVDIKLTANSFKTSRVLVPVQTGTNYYLDWIYCSTSGPGSLLRLAYGGNGGVATSGIKAGVDLMDDGNNRGRVLLRASTGSASNIAVSVGDYSGNPKGISASEFSTTSSKRYKDNIEDLSEEDAKKILKLRPVSFVYKSDNKKRRHNGFIAEEAVEVDEAPIAYIIDDETKEKKPDAINYTEYIAPMIKLLQSQEKRIQELEAKLGLR